MTQQIIKALEDESLDFIMECVGAPRDYNDGKSAMRDWFLNKLKAIAIVRANSGWIPVDNIDVEIAIAEAIQLIPNNMTYEEKGVPILKYLEKLGYRVMQAGGE